MKILSKVEFNMGNIEKCICKTCPVQAESACVKQKKMKTQEMMESKMMPDAEMVPGVYCATGKASCGDLDVSKMCQCNECPLWEECDLISGQPMGYYCRDGQAE
ncbi:MAG: DUF2769 domain-containing protein [Methanobacteriaceae archaeon]|nr:DUF2769 domain-containing protein [Methanobacteriaceae archaeon]